MSGPPPRPDLHAELPSGARGALRSTLGRGAHRRVRWSMYGAFLLLAAMALFMDWYGTRDERVRAADAEIIHLAGLQATFTQRMGRLAASIAAAPHIEPSQVEALAQALDQSRSEALLVEALLAAQGALAPADARQQRRSLEAWQAARERLWYRSDALLRHLDTADAAAAAATALEVQVETELAMKAAVALTDELRGAAQRHAQGQARLLDGGVVLTLLLLVLLALLVVEPTARAVESQVAQFALQSRDLERLALVASRTNNIVFITDRKDRVQWANAAFTRVSGYALEEVLGRLPGELLSHPDADPEKIVQIYEAIEQGVGLRVELLNRTRDGKDLWCDVDLQPLHGADGEVNGFVSVNTDITPQVAERLRTRTLLATMPAGMVVLSAGGEIIEVNRSAEAMLGQSQAQLMGRMTRGDSWQALREDHSVYPEDDLPPLRTLRTGVGVQGETVGITLADGRQRWLLVNTAPLVDPAGRHDGVLTCFVDATEQRRLQDQLRMLACTDALTGLPNRAVVLDRVQRAIAHARRHPGYGFAVLFMDFDRFKQVNDTLGHAAGDELLRQTAARLEVALRPGDAVARVESQLQTAARIGGDEFVVVLEGTRSSDDARLVADRLLELLSLPYQLGPHAVQSGVSIGMVTSETAADTADAVLRDADTAMYEAKRAGRGRCVLFDSSMHDRVVRLLEMENDLRQALREHELFVVYQPVVELGSGALAGVEALARWRHPQRGLVPPSEFIPVAEEAGLIDAIGNFVLRAACAQFSAWRVELGERAPRQLAVNLSRAQLKLPGLVPEVKWILEQAGMRASDLQLEVTESLAAQDEGVQATLRALKELGVTLALDDFGTGYSSLACLHQLPVDTVKIDRSFIAHAETVEYHRVLIEATIRVARTLGMTTVAEGIETAGQAALMEQMACDLGQGYLYGRPMAGEDLAAWVSPALAGASS